MKKQNTFEKIDTEEQKEIKRLKAEIEKLRNKVEIEGLKNKIDELKEQEGNRQATPEASMTDLTGYEEEFVRLKEDAVKKQKQYKKNHIIQLIGQIISLTIAGLIVNYLLHLKTVIDLFELDENTMKIVIPVTLAVFAFIGLQTFLTLMRVIVSDPNKITDQTLSYLSLTAKEHILDPKGSVLREKYGTAKWNAITRT